MVIIGEVHTGLLQHSTALPALDCEVLLSLREGEILRRAERPTALVISPSVLTSVDCALPSSKNAQIQGAGTVSTRAVVVGGRVLQSSSHAVIDSGDRRQYWSHYLARPGVIEVLGKADLDDLSAGFVTGRARPRGLDIEAIGARIMDQIQRSRVLDQRPPMPATRSRLCWAVEQVADPDFRPRARVRVVGPMLRTMELTVGPGATDRVIALCEDIALHDWLLSTLLSLLEIVRGARQTPAERILRLAPVIETLLDLWMPGAHVAADVMPIWDDLENAPGYSRQWNALVGWIRDQISMITMSLLQAHALAEVSGQPKNT